MDNTNNNFNNVQLPSYMMGIPFQLSSENVKTKMSQLGKSDSHTFLNLVLDEVITNFKEKNEFKVLSETILEDTKRELVISYFGKKFPVKLYFKDYLVNMYSQKTYLSTEELKTLEDSIGVVCEVVFTSNIKSSYLFQLKLVNSMFKDICALVDCTTNSLFSGKWLNSMATSTVSPSLTHIYNLIIEHDEEGNVWIHTRGLRRCNLYEIELLNLNGENYQYCSLVLPYLISNLVENKSQPEKEPILIGDKISLWLEKTQDSLSNFNKIIGVRPKDRKKLDEFYMTAYAYINNSKKEISELLPLLENPDFLENLIEKERISIMAKEFFDFFIKVVEKQEVALTLKKYIKNLKNPDPQIFEGRIKATFPIDEDYMTQNRRWETLWFKFVSTTNSRTIKGELLDDAKYIDELSKGDIVEFGFEIINDWIIFSEIGELTPENLYLLV